MIARSCFRRPRDLVVTCSSRRCTAIRAALWRVFTERGLQSGDNESWSFTAWPLLHVVGDKHFAAFLRSLNARQQADIFKQVFYEGSYYAEPNRERLLCAAFPRRRGYVPQAAATKASNHAMEPTPPDLIMSLFAAQPFTCSQPRPRRRGSSWSR